MAQHSIHTMTFDFRGTLESEGIVTLQNAQEDIQAAITYLQREDVIREYKIDRRRLILGGISFGGGMALTYAANHPQIKRIFSLAGDDYGEFAREYKRNPEYAAMIDGLFEALRTSSETVRFADYDMIKDLTQNPEPYDLRLNAAALADRDILLIGGWDDSNVTIDHKILPFYRALQEAGAQDVQIVAFQDDHSFEKSGEEIAALIIRWLKSPEPGKE